MAGTATTDVRPPEALGDGPRDRTPWGVAVWAAPAVWALVLAWWIPRGPASTAESLTCLAVSVAVGLLVGRVTGTRWGVLTAPVVFAVVLELARVDLVGPTVDLPGLTTYGVIALVTGRLFDAVVILAPMAWGAAAGAAWHRRAAGASDGGTPGWRRWIGRLALAGTGAVLLLVTALVARPASTAPITGPDGDPVPGSVAELTTVDVNGHELGLMIRGEDRDNPVLLFLAGGPGGTELGGMRRHLAELESSVTVVTWDQRGTGRSYGELDPTDTLTPDSVLADTLAVTDHLRERFDQDRILLAGQSWGSLLGVLAVQASPERYAGYVGTGQMVSPAATDRIYWEDTLAWARETGRDDLVATLEELGPPPYDDIRDYEQVLPHEPDLYPYDRSGNSEGSGQMAENLLVREYSLTEQVRALAGTVDTFAVLYPQVQDVDLGATATDLEVPLFFVQGAHETPGRAEPFEEWYAALDAPTKDRIVLGTSGHRPLFEQPDEFVSYLTDVVLPGTTTAP